MKRLIAILAVFLCSCQTSLDLPKVHGNDEVGHIPTYTEMHPIRFTGIKFDIPVGELYAVYPYWRFSFPNVDIGIMSCNLSHRYRFGRSKAYWRPGSIPSWKWEKESNKFVEEPLLEQGYDIVTEIGKIYVPRENMYRSELEFAASIVDLKMNLCHLYNGLVFMDMSQVGGSAYAKIKWEIYDPLRRKSLGTITTEGIGYVDEPVQGGLDVLLLNTIEQAAINLGQNQKFYDIVVKGEDASEKEEKHPYLEITTDKRPYNKPLKENFSFIRRAVLTVRTGAGHGSGFYINNEGYALTNYHVVGDAKTVAVTDFSGTSHMAKVVRVHKMRDVALLKVDVFDNPVMALQLKKQPKELDRVYSLGTPLSEGLKVTVTEGIISTFRYPRKTGMGLIQASVPIAAGNSGGPLLDEKGNVIAIAVSARGDRNGTVYSNFIPIRDALYQLNIKMVKPTY